MIFEKYPAADISASIVWINMLPEDSLEAAAPSINVLNDKRGRHFYDPNQIAGREAAASVGCDGYVGWDIYLFYQPGILWHGSLPKPTFWMHQLKDEWVDPEHYRTGKDLKGELSHSVKMLLNSLQT